MPTPKPQWLEDVTEAAISDQPTTAINTGSWKSVEPHYEDKLPPCSQACPAGNDISKVIMLLASGDASAAASLLRSGNPLPATLGRVCPHFCEGCCNRESTGGTIAVHMLERFLGDYSLDNAQQLHPAPRTGKKIAVIGAGPAGISAAYTLALKGHNVEVFDDKPQAGGYLRTGIPDYRLPKSVLDREIAQVNRLGVSFKQNVRVGRDVSIDDLMSRFDAVVAAIGLHKSRGLNVPGSDHANVYNGVDLLEQILEGKAPKLPDTIAVVGGGNTAMDVARSVLRLGAKPIVVYRRTEAEMPAIAAEVQEAKQEGVEFRFLVAPKSVVIEKGSIVALECQQMQLGEPDASGRRAPVAIPGSVFRIPVSGIVSAIGESADFSFVSPSVASSGKYFAAGDASTGDGTVTAAVGDGRRVATLVDSYLSTGTREPEMPSLQSFWKREVNFDKVVESKLLNHAYFSWKPEPEIPVAHQNVPPTSFDEIIQGLDLEAAILEARRCMACGTCNECMNCYFWCPDAAIHHQDGNSGLTIDSMHCKGCGICVEECPRNAMTMGEVSR